MEQELENKTEDYGDEAIKKRKRKQRVGMAAIIIALTAISAGCITVFIRTRKSDDNMSNQGFGQRGAGFDGENIVTATGTTSVGIDAVTFDIDFLENTSLYVEEVYLESGDEVEVGTKYLKLTDSSIEEARKELESTLLSAQLEYRSGVISNKESQISAKYDYDLAILEAEQAQGVYDDTIASLQVQLDKAKAAYDDANEEYNELYNAIENDTFYADYDVAALKKAYEDAYDLYVTKMEEWELDEDDLSQSSQDMGTTGTVSGLTLSGAAGDNTDPSEGDGTGDDAGTGNDGESGDNTEPSDDKDTNKDNDKTPNVGGAPNNGEMPSNGEMPMNNGGGGGGMSASSEADEEKWIKKTASLLKAEAEEAEEEYEQALSDYEDALDSAELDIQKLYLDLETAREDYEDAQLRFQKQSQSAKTQYETAIVKGQTAQLDYDTQLTSLEEQLDKLEDAKDEAQDNLETFEATIGDGYLYTEEAGTILMVMTKEDNALAGGEMLFAYSNPEKISVSVSVSQDYIAQLYVGENATVIIDENGQYTGTVQTINPVSSSDNRTSVYYTVTVLLDAEDISGLSANLTATVMFGDIEMPENTDNNQQNGEKPQDMDNDQQNGEKPQDMDNNQQNGEKPQDMDNDQQNGEMPQGMDKDQNMNDKPQGEKHE